MGVLPACNFTMCMECNSGVRKLCRIPQNWIYGQLIPVMWVLGSEPGYSARATNAFNS